MSAPDPRIVNVKDTGQSVERMGLNAPEDGVPLNVEQLGYVKRQSANTQAELWNSILSEHPKYAPAVCGHRVGVADEKRDRYYPLVWVAA